mgnify:FL=1
MSFNRMISITDIEKRRRNGGQNGNGNGVLTETSDTGRIEGRISGENAYMGRTYMDVPGIDSNIFIITDEELMTGDFVKVKVTGINDYDLIGQLDE